MNKIIGYEAIESLRLMSDEEIDAVYLSLVNMGLFPHDGKIRVCDFIYDNFNRDPNEWVRALTHGPILTGSTKISLVRYTLYMNMALNRSCRDFFEELNTMLYFYREEYNMNL